MTVAASAFQHLDEQPIKRFHLLALFTTGMGVFTDGYNLSSIGVVLPLVLASFGVDHIGGLQSGFLAGSALIGAAIGALIFGALAQHGRKRYYGVDVTLMAVAAAAQIFAHDMWSLIAIRFVLGIGIGADYVLSPTIMAEHANRRDRGKKIAFGFGVFWCLGAFVAAVVLLVVLSGSRPRRSGGSSSLSARYRRCRCCICGEKCRKPRATWRGSRATVLGRARSSPASRDARLTHPRWLIVARGTGPRLIGSSEPVGGSRRSDINAPRLHQIGTAPPIVVRCIRRRSGRS